MKSHITWALVGASVVALGFSSVVATGAAWRASAPASNGPTLNAGRLDISSGNFGDQMYELSDFGRENMTSSSAVAKPLEVFNSGNVPMSYTVESVVVTPQAMATTAPPLRLVIARVDDAQGCTTGVTGDIYNGAMDGASTTKPISVADGASTMLCLVASLDNGAVAGQAGTAAFTFRALVSR
ncbi:hypothetical protein ACWIE7_18390 [Dietzia sp. NPDC055343]